MLVFKASQSVDLFGNNLLSAALDLDSGFGLTMVYYTNVDHLGHEFGPDSDEIRDEIMKVRGTHPCTDKLLSKDATRLYYRINFLQVDEKLGDFLLQLEALGLRDSTNIVLLTDHGKRSSLNKKFRKKTLND